MTLQVELDADEYREFMEAHADMIAAGYDPGEVFVAESLLTLYRLLRIGILMEESGHREWEGFTQEEIDGMISHGSAVLGLDPDDLQSAEAVRAFITFRTERLADMKYTDYLQTPEWKDVRRFALHRADHRCQACNRAKGLHVHHRTYDHRGYERLTDVTVLCAGCHKAFHENRRLER